MNFLITLLMLGGLGALIVLNKTGKASPALSGGILAFVVIGAGASINRSCKPPEDPMANEKIAISESMGWQVAQLLNADFPEESEILLLYAELDPAEHIVSNSPFAHSRTGLLDALDSRHTVSEFVVQLRPMAEYGLMMDELEAAREAHPTADAIVSLVGAPHGIRKNPDALRGAPPIYAVCDEEAPRLRKMAARGIAVIVVPREGAVWVILPENTHQAVFNAYCTVLRRASS